MFGQAAPIIDANRVRLAVAAFMARIGDGGYFSPLGFYLRCEQCADGCFCIDLGDSRREFMAAFDACGCADWVRRFAFRTYLCWCFAGCPVLACFLDEGLVNRSMPDDIPAEAQHQRIL